MSQQEKPELVLKDTIAGLPIWYYPDNAVSDIHIQNVITTIKKLPWKVPVLLVNQGYQFVLPRQFTDFYTDLKNTPIPSNNGWNLTKRNVKTYDNILGSSNYQKRIITIPEFYINGGTNELTPIINNKPISRLLHHEIGHSIDYTFGKKEIPFYSLDSRFPAFLRDFKRDYQQIEQKKRNELRYNFFSALFPTEVFADLIAEELTKDSNEVKTLFPESYSHLEKHIFKHIYSLRFFSFKL